MFQCLRQRLGGFLQTARQADLKFSETVREARHQTADIALMPLVDAIGAEFGHHPGLARWIVELRNDLIDHLDLLAGPADAEAEATRRHAVEQRYAVNLLVDHSEEPHAPVVLEPTPSYENLFGRFEFRFESGVRGSVFARKRKNRFISSYVNGLCREPADRRQFDGPGASTEPAR